MPKRNKFTREVYNIYYKKKICRRCKCGCGGITKPGNKHIAGHYWKNRNLTEEHKLNIALSLMNRKQSVGHRLNNALAQTGIKKSKATKLKMSLAKIGKKQSVEHIKNKSIAKIKFNPNDKYCNIWRDKEYIKDIRKDYCENANCNKISKRLHNHHIHLDKKRCAPWEIMTLCASCHSWLHRVLEEKQYVPVNPKSFIIINRPDHVSYIHKATRKIIRIERVIL